MGASILAKMQDDLSAARGGHRHCKSRMFHPKNSLMLLHDGPAAACALNRARFDTLFLTHDISGIGVHRQCGDVDASSKDVQNLKPCKLVSMVSVFLFKLLAGNGQPTAPNL